MVVRARIFSTQLITIEKICPRIRISHSLTYIFGIKSAIRKGPRIRQLGPWKFMVRFRPFLDPRFPTFIKFYSDNFIAT